MTCIYCHRREPDDIDVLIDAGWIAYYYAGQQEMTGPVCPECCGRHLRQDDNWEWEVVVPEAIAHRYNYAPVDVTEAPCEGQLLLALSSGVSAAVDGL